MRSGVSGGRIPQVEASEVVPGLYIGSKPPHGRHAVDVIVLAAEEYQPHASRFPGAQVIHVPLDDAPLRQMRSDEIESAVSVGKAVAAHLRAGRRVLVTCAMGLNRSSLVAAIAMHTVYGMSADEIITRIRHARGAWALSNPNFEKLVRVVASAAAAKHA